jgi:hypothetical protein
MATQTDDILEHFGVKGMRWGVRRSDKELGRSRKGPKDPDSEDASKKKSLQVKVKKNRSTDSLTNAELKALNERLQLEQNYGQLVSRERANAPKSPMSKGASWAGNMAGQVANQTVKNIASTVLTNQVKTLMPDSILDPTKAASDKQKGLDDLLSPYTTKKKK